MDKVLCIDDSNRPNEIPLSKWVKKGEWYTPIKFMYLTQQNICGFKLQELNIDDCYPYTFFGCFRFDVEIIEVLRLVEEKELELEEI